MDTKLLRGMKLDYGHKITERNENLIMYGSPFVRADK